jgi:Ricin-type beta-trefoil lectin domain
VKRLFSVIVLGSLLLTGLGLSGCGVTVGPGLGDATAVHQIQLAIYTPLCIDVLDASTASGAEVQVYPCGTGKRSQEWQFSPIGATTASGFNIVNLNSQMCMSVVNTPDTAPGQHVDQETCTANAPNQIWTMTKAPGSEAGYQFISAASNQCLDVPYGAAASVFQLQQYTCTPMDPAQGWTTTTVTAGNVP